MKGDQIRKVLYEHKIKQTALAEQIGMTQSNLSATFLSADVKSSIIERIAEATNIPIAEFYGEENYRGATTQINSNNTDTTISENTAIIAQALTEIAEQRKATQQAIAEISEQRKCTQQALALAAQKK